MVDYFPESEMAPRTHMLYNKCLARWFAGYDNALEHMIENHERAMESLRTNPTITNSRMNHHAFLGAMNRYVKEYLVPKDPKWIPISKIWTQTMMENGKVFQEHRDAGEPTEKQKERVVLWADVIKARDELPTGIAKLLLGFYSYIPPVRSDLYDCEIIREGMKAPADKNHLVIGEDYTLVIVDYKNKKSHGIVNIVLPKPLRDLFNACDDMKLIKTHLFTGRFGTAHTRASFGKMSAKVLSEAMGKQTSLLMLRYSYLSSLDYNQSNKVLKEIAYKMCHTMGVQRGYRLDTEEAKNEVVVPEE